jgi:hypothetical protein
MDNKIPCVKCGEMILPSTAEKTGGICMACKQGIRQNIEASKRYYEELKKYNPYRELWKSLVFRVHKTEKGFSGLNSAEKIYYAVSILQGEVFNGGFDQFFWNSSGDLYEAIIAGLERLEAFETLNLVQQARIVLFSNSMPPPETKDRRELLRILEEKEGLQAFDILDAAFWKDPDKLNEKLTRFADLQGLVKPFMKE